MNCSEGLLCLYCTYREGHVTSLAGYLDLLIETTDHALHQGHLIRKRTCFLSIGNVQLNLFFVVGTPTDKIHFSRILSVGGVYVYLLTCRIVVFAEQLESGIMTFNKHLFVSRQSHPPLYELVT